MASKIQKGSFLKLSEREFEVAHLLLNGDRTIDIAVKLGVKTNTISTFKRIIYLKMGVKSSIGLYQIALAEGVCSFPLIA